MLSKIGVRLVMCGFALAASFSAGASCAQASERVINAADIVIFPPFSFKDPKSGELMGFDRDLFEAMAKKVGANVKWSEFSFAELTSFAPLKTKRVDIYGGGAMSDTPERRENGVSFIDFVYDPLVFFTLSRNVDQFKSQDALCGKRVAITRSGTTTAQAKEWSEENCTKAGRPALDVIASDSSATSQSMLKQGRAEASINGAASLSNSNKIEGNVYIAIGKPLDKSIYGMAFLNENRELGDALKKALDELIADGTYVQLLHKWGLSDDSSIGQTSSINAGWSLPK